MKPAKRFIQTLVAFICKQLEHFAHEDKDHRIQELEDQLANKAVQAKSVPASSALPVVEPANVEPQSNHRRIVVKSDLSEHLFDMNFGVEDRSLASNAPLASTAVAVKKW